MSKIHTNHSGVAFESVSVRLWCDYLNGTSTEVSALKNLIFQCSMLGKKIKDWQQDICEKCRCRRHFTVSSRVRCTCFAETNQTWNYFLTWSFRGNATFTWKDWRRKENEADWRNTLLFWGVRLRLYVFFLFYNSYLVDPASSHMLVSKIKPCMSKYKQLCTVKLRMAH
jgi:hypothetical protein